MNNRRFDAAVIGAGPCGVAAALQLVRSGFGVLLFEARSVGGLLRTANRVENYPGFPGGIPGPELCGLLAKHLAAAGVRVVADEVTEAAPVAGGYALKTLSGRVASCRALIVATGTRPVTGIFSEPPSLVGRRIFYEAADVSLDCPGEHVLVAGGGDAAYDYALNLAGRGARVTILRRGEPRCLPLLLERARRAERIAERPGAALLSVAAAGESGGAGESGEGGIAARISRGGGEEEVVVADRLLIACGREPEDGLLRGLARSGRVANHLAPDLFAGGDVVRGPFRQAGIAVGDGLLAAMSAARFLGSQSHPEGQGKGAPVVPPAPFHPQGG